MKWELTTVLSILQIICSLDIPNTSLKSNKNFNKARIKNSKIPSNPAQSAIDSEISHDIVESFFPDVIYPTSIIEAAQPFYYSSPGFDDVLGPFASNVKSSYTNLNSEKGKLPKNAHPVSKASEKNYDHTALRTITDQGNRVEVPSTNEPLFSDNVNNNNIEYDESNLTEDYRNNCTHDANETHLYYDEQNHLSQDMEEDSNGNISCNETEDMNVNYVDNRATGTLLENETASEVLDEAVLEDSTKLKQNSDSNKTFCVTPNYVMTSNTGNSHEDFVNDIMNIFSLIEETIRAISVVEFVVSKTLGALGFEDKQNETIKSRIANYKSGAIEESYAGNNADFFNYDYENVNGFVTNSSHEHTDLFNENGEIDLNALTCDIQQNEFSANDTITKFNSNNNQSDYNMFDEMPV